MQQPPGFLVARRRGRENRESGFSLAQGQAACNPEIGQVRGHTPLLSPRRIVLMPDQIPVPPPPPSGTDPQAIPQPKSPGLDIGPGVGVGVTQDMAAPERKLPPARIVLIALAGLAIALAVYGFLGRAKPQGAGSVDNLAVVELPNQNAVLVAATVTLHNSGEKPLWIHTIQGKLKMPDNEYSDDAASAVDFDRYFQAFPDLKQGARSALMPETKILPGNEASGTVIVSFPVTLNWLPPAGAIALETNVALG